MSPLGHPSFPTSSHSGLHGAVQAMSSRTRSTSSEEIMISFKMWGGQQKGTFCLQTLSFPKGKGRSFLYIQM